MKFLTMRTEEEIRVGVKTEKGIIAINKTLEEVLTGGKKVLEEIASNIELTLADEDYQGYLDEEELNLGPCVPNPGKIICVGLNYRKHAEECNLPIPEYPLLFCKFKNSLSAHGDEVVIPRNAHKGDYEAELAIIIGKKAKGVSKEDALEYVFGYSSANDLSVRDWQFRTSQWILGKTPDGFCPLGPYLVTADEVGNPNDLRIRSYVNGEVRQDSHTSDMIFYCNEIVSYISEHMTLEPGDIILTGTPEGVITGYPEEKQVWLKDGDEVIVEIEKLGKISSKMKKEM